MRVPPRLAILLGLVLSPWLIIQSRPVTAAERPRPRLGMNLSGLVYWNTELAFVDVFHLSSAWISHGPNGTHPRLDLDEHGWIKRLDTGVTATALMCSFPGGHYPSGPFTVLYDGKGIMTVHGAGLQVSVKEPGRIVFSVDSTKGGFYLLIRKTDPTDYIRNIRVIMPGFEETYEREPFHPAFLARWRGVACLRFMSWMKTNDSKIREWTDRPDLDTATYTKDGAPLELLIDLANRQGADPWFCMPHQADDDYVRRFATMVRDRLDPKLRVYIEYSNEVWNAGYPQHRYAADQGVKLGLSKNRTVAAWRYTARRSVEIFGIWEDVFGGTDRLVRVLPSQAVNTYATEQILSFQDAYRHADALAVAPYLHFTPGPDSSPTDAQVAQWSLGQLFQWLGSQTLPETIDYLRQQKAMADRFGLRLVAYEGGQGLVGANVSAKNNVALTQLFHQANADPRMGLLYDRYLSAWAEVGGDLFCNFESVSQWTKYGSWGLLQFADDDPRRSPKFMAVFRWARRYGQPVSLSGR